MSKIDGLELFPDFAGWILGDASLRFQSIFGGPVAAPLSDFGEFRQKLVTLKNVVGPKNC